MPTYELEKDGTIYEVEADTPEAAVSALNKMTAAQQPRTAMDEFRRIGGAAAGVAETAALGVGGVGVEILSGLRGIGAGLVPGGQTGAEAVESTQQFFAPMLQPRTEVGQNLTGSLGDIGAEIERFADTLGEVSGEPTDTLGATAVKTALMAAPAIVGGRQFARNRATAAPEPEAQPPQPPAPTLNELKTKAGKAYDAVTEAGVVIEPQSAGQLALRIVDDLADIDADLNPAASAALRKVTDRLASDQPLSFDDIYKMRRIAKKAADASKVSNPDDARMAGRLRRILDDYMDNLGEPDVVTGDAAAAVSNIQVARSTYKQYKKAEVIENLIERAQARSEANYSGANFDTALRQEFKSLATAKNQAREFAKFTPLEQAAIRAVSKGNLRSNTLRELGKFNVFSPVGGGVGALLGNMMGGPLGMVLVPLVGTAARRGANKATKSAADAASEMVRRGPQDGQQ